MIASLAVVQASFRQAKQLHALGFEQIKTLSPSPFFIVFVLGQRFDAPLADDECPGHAW